MEERDLKSLTAEEGKAIEGNTSKGTKQGEGQPTKRTAYNRLLQRPVGHGGRPASQPPKSLSVSKGLRQTRVASQQLTPSPKKETKERSSSSVPRLDTKKSTSEVLEEIAMKGDVLRAQENVKTVREVLESLVSTGDDPMAKYLVECGRKVVESGGNQQDFGLFSDALLQSGLSVDTFRSKQTSQPVSVPLSLADSKRQTASLKDQMDACVSALSPFFFADLKGKQPPIPDAELVVYCFLSLLKTRDEDLEIPDGFKVMHHRTWKAVQLHAARPGKIVQAVKSLPQAIKHGKLTSAAFAHVQALIAPISVDKIASDEMAEMMMRYVETAVAYAKSCETEREKETSSLQFMKLRDASPRRKLLTSLLNRSTEESREEDPPVFRDSLRVEKTGQEASSDDLEESKAIEIAQPAVISLTEVAFPGPYGSVSETASEPQMLQSNRASEVHSKPEVKDSPSKQKPVNVSRPNTTPVKPSPRKVLQDRIKSPQKSPFKPKSVSKPETAIKPVISSAKKRPVLKAKPEPEIIVETPEKMRIALLLEVKLRVFLQEKVINLKSIAEPTNEEEVVRLMEAFTKELEHCGEVIEGVDVTAYTAKMTFSSVSALLVSVKTRQMEAQQSPDSWTHREIQRQKDRMNQTLTRLQMRKSLS